jgi:hypothetical protein
MKGRAFDGEVYVSFIENVIQSLVSHNLSGFTFIMDNLAVHKVSNVISLSTNSGNFPLFL